MSNPPRGPMPRDSAVAAAPSSHGVFPSRRSVSSWYAALWKYSTHIWDQTSYIFQALAGLSKKLSSLKMVYFTTYSGFVYSWIVFLFYSILHLSGRSLFRNTTWPCGPQVTTTSFRLRKRHSELSATCVGCERTNSVWTFERMIK